MKRESLIKKITKIEASITANQERLAMLKTELIEAEKEDLYKAVTENNLTVDQTIELFMKLKGSQEQLTLDEAETLSPLEKSAPVGEESITVKIREKEQPKDEKSF